MSLTFTEAKHIALPFMEQKQPNKPYRLKYALDAGEILIAFPGEEEHSRVYMDYMVVGNDPVGGADYETSDAYRAINGEFVKVDLTEEEDTAMQELIKYMADNGTLPPGSLPTFERE